MTTKKTLATLLGLLLAGSLSMATAACGDTGAANTDSGADAASQTEGAADTADTGAGFEEIPIGTDVELEGEINAAAVYFQPIDMEPAGMGLSAAESNLHLEADITALEGNDLGYGAGDFVPGLTVDYVITDKNDPSNTQEGTFMEMVASDGPHYGGNIALDKDGEYTLTFKIHSPAENGWMLHTDPETGVTGHWWNEPLEATFDWDYTVHQW